VGLGRDGSSSSSLEQERFVSRGLDGLVIKSWTNTGELAVWCFVLGWAGWHCSSSPQERSELRGLDGLLTRNGLTQMSWLWCRLLVGAGWHCSSSPHERSELRGLDGSRMREMDQRRWAGSVELAFDCNDTGWQSALQLTQFDMFKQQVYARGFVCCKLRR
jgi:hypothetical protein